VHEVYSLKIDESKLATIKEAISSDCGPKRCSVTNCWKERENFIVCNADLSFFLKDEKLAMLGRVRRRLLKYNLDVAFCGHDSNYTATTRMVLCSLVAGAIANGQGCAHTDDVEEVGLGSEQLGACSTRPTVSK
jgi:hypothetical protein